MAKLTAFLFASSTIVANAHPSLIAHDHPHGIPALTGLDSLMVITLVAAFALVALKQVRS